VGEDAASKAQAAINTNVAGKPFKNMRVIKMMEKLNWKYVLIEILIIVIGILIALRVDSWKENRNTKLRELQTLKELKQELSSDLNTIRSMQNRCDDVISNLGVLQLNLYRQKPYQDSLQDYAYRIVYEIQFQYRNSAFNNLKTIGVDLISNDSIKYRLVELYDYTYPRLSRMIDIEANKSKYSDFFESQRILDYKLPNGQQNLEIKEILNPEIFNDPKFLDIVTTKMGSFIIVKRRFNMLHDDVQLLINAITSEIKENE